MRRTIASSPHCAGACHGDETEGGARRFSTAALASAAPTFGQGFYEAKIKTTGGTDYLASFWLQSESVEINIVEFTNNNNGTGDLFLADYDCFSAAGTVAHDKGPAITYGRCAPLAFPFRLRCPPLCGHGRHHRCV